MHTPPSPEELLAAAGVPKPRPRRRKIAFGWYGGKFSHLKWLLPLLPPAHHYCEPFGGSAAVLLNREPAPVETYNDLDGEVVTFFRVLREQPDALIQALAATPFSREEFARAIREPAEGLPDLERARRFYIRARQVRIGLAQTASPGKWAHCRLASTRGMANAVSRWLGSAHDLTALAGRLLRVQIENRPALEVIRRYDSPETLFYVDPPYPSQARRSPQAYRFELSDRDHEELADLLHQVSGKVAISGYRCRLMDRLYGGWTCLPAPPKRCHSVKQLRQEALWVNYAPEEQGFRNADCGPVEEGWGRRYRSFSVPGVRAARNSTVCVRWIASVRSRERAPACGMMLIS